MLSIWIIHRDPKDRAAIARIAGVDERAVLASPTDRVLSGAEAPTVVVLGLSGDFELELDFVQRFAAKLAHCSWILLPAARDLDEATRLFDTLPAEVLAYPPDPRALRRALRAAVQRRHADPLSARQGRAELQHRFTRWFGDLELPELMRALDPRLARVPLLIHGEEGTGRGLLARYVHVFAGRAEHDLVQVACRRESRADDLMRQMAQGASHGRSDLLTFYFEDVDRLPAAVQRRVRDWIEFGLPEGALRRHGHRFMASASSASDFDREPGLDPRLGETLSGLTIALPPLRERPSHVTPFTQQTAEAFARAHGERVRLFGPSALAKLESYPWPGNLHELEAVVTRTLSFTSADPIEPIHLRFPSDVHWLDEDMARADLEPETPRPLPAPRTQPEAAAPEAVLKQERRPVEAQVEEEAVEDLSDLDPGAARGHEADLDVGRVASLGDAPVDEDELEAAYTLSDDEEESLFPTDDLEDEDHDELPEAEFEASTSEPEVLAEVALESDDEVMAGVALESVDEVMAGVALRAGGGGRRGHGGVALESEADAIEEAGPETVAEVELIEDGEISSALFGLDGAGDVMPEELLPELEPLEPPLRPLPDAHGDAPSAERMALEALPFEGAEPETPASSDAEPSSADAPPLDGAQASALDEPIDGPLGPVHPATPETDQPRDARLQQLIGAIAHEVRNPLVSIRTFSELLPDHYDDPEFRTHFRELVVKDVERIDRVVARLQALAETTTKTETLNVARLLDRLLDDRRATIQSRRLLVLKELDHASPLVYAHPDQLEDALAGLLDRAIEQATERGDVYLASKYNVHGPGDRPNMRILIRHTRASRGTQPAPAAGTAEMLLDLVLAERLLEAQGGRLTVDDAEANESVIVVDLPAP